MMPTDFDAALDRYLRPPERPPSDSEGPRLDGLDGLDAVRSDRHVADALPFLGLSLDEFAARDIALEVRVGWLPIPLWFVSGERELPALLAEGVTRGRIWTAAELSALLSLPNPPTAVQHLAQAKLQFDGEITDVGKPTTPSSG